MPSNIYTASVEEIQKLLGQNFHHDTVTASMLWIFKSLLNQVKKFRSLNMLVILCRKGDGEVITGSQKRNGAHCIQRSIPSQQETDFSVESLWTFLWEGQWKRQSSDLNPGGALLHKMRT